MLLLWIAITVVGKPAKDPRELKCLSMVLHLQCSTGMRWDWYLFLGLFYWNFSLNLFISTPYCFLPNLYLSRRYSKPWIFQREMILPWWYKVFSLFAHFFAPVFTPLKSQFIPSQNFKWITLQHKHCMILPVTYCPWNIETGSPGVQILSSPSFQSIHAIIRIWKSIDATC